MIFQRDRHAPSRSFDSGGNLRVQRTPSRSYDDVEAADGGGGGSIDTIERALETYDPSRDEGSLARRARELGLRGAHNKANTGSPVAGGSTVWAPSSSTRAGSDMAESRSFENLQRLASQLTNVQGRINTHIDMLLKQESDVFLDEWTIDRSHLKIGRELGRGMFGVIREARWRGTPVAIKMLHLDVNHYMDENSELFAKELTAMRQLHHPNIVQFLGLARLPEPGIVMELFPHGSVEDYVTKSRWLRYSTARRFAYEMANALAYLHGRKPKMFIHRDIKPSNFMLTSSLSVKLGDFGVSRGFRDLSTRPSNQNFSDLGAEDSKESRGHQLSGEPATDDTIDIDAGPGMEQTSNVGTARYMAPEVRSGSTQTYRPGYGDDEQDGFVADVDYTRASYSSRADIWSLGLVFFFIFESKPPMLGPGAGTPASYAAALRRGERPTFDKSPSEVRRIVRACWSNEPSDRPSANALVACVEALPTKKQTKRRGLALCRTTDILTDDDSVVAPILARSSPHASKSNSERRPSVRAERQKQNKLREMGEQKLALQIAWDTELRKAHTPSPRIASGSERSERQQSDTGSGSGSGSGYGGDRSSNGQPCAHKAVVFVTPRQGGGAGFGGGTCGADGLVWHPPSPASLALAANANANIVAAGTSPSANPGASTATGATAEIGASISATATANSTITVSSTAGDGSGGDGSGNGGSGNGRSGNAGSGNRSAFSTFEGGSPNSAVASGSEEKQSPSSNRFASMMAADALTSITIVQPESPTILITIAQDPLPVSPGLPVQPTAPPIPTTPPRTSVPTTLAMDTAAAASTAITTADNGVSSYGAGTIMTPEVAEAVVSAAVPVERLVTKATTAAATTSAPT